MYEKVEGMKIICKEWLQYTHPKLVNMVHFGITLSQSLAFGYNIITITLNFTTTDQKKKNHIFYLPQKVVTFTTMMRNTLFFTIFNIHSPTPVTFATLIITYTTIDRNIFIVHTVCIIDFA